MTHIDDNDTGYYSLVCIAVKDEDANDYLFKEVDSAVKISSINGNTYYEYPYWLKWYTEYAVAIDRVMDYLDQLGDLNFGYLRVGEDSEDITRKGNPFEFDMCIDIRISIPPRHKIKGIRNND